MQTLTRLLLILICVMYAGCGSKSPFDYVPVNGRITYEDGSAIPAGGIRLHFTAQDAPAVEGAHPRPGVANIDDKGEFSCVTSYKYCDGLIPGRHKVAIQQATASNGQLLVPPEYTSIATTPLTIDTAEAPFEIKVPKPAPARKR
jgi:hypothetical protein